MEAIKCNCQRWPYTENKAIKMSKTKAIIDCALNRLQIAAS